MPDPTAAPWVDWGGAGPLLHLAHANGFPPEAYRALATRLAARFRTVSTGLLPLWPGASPGSVRSWDDLTQGLLAALRSRGVRGAVGVGHSVGAVCSMKASVADPGLFDRLVLIDPVLFCGPRALAWGLMKRLRLARLAPIVRGALRRRDHWASREEVLASWTGKPLFASFDPGALQDYVDSALVVAPGGGVSLRYTPDWEARVFETTPSDEWRTVAAIPVPVLVIRGERSDTFTAAAARRLRVCLPTARVVEVPGTTHMLPFERPDVVADVVAGFLS